MQAKTCSTWNNIEERMRFIVRSIASDSYIKISNNHELIYPIIHELHDQAKLLLIDLQEYDDAKRIKDIVDRVINIDQIRKDLNQIDGET